MPVLVLCVVAPAQVASCLSCITVPYFLNLGPSSTRLQVNGQCQSMGTCCSGMEYGVQLNSPLILDTDLSVCLCLYRFLHVLCTMSHISFVDTLGPHTHRQLHERKQPHNGNDTKECEALILNQMLGCGQHYNYFGTCSLLCPIQQLTGGPSWACPPHYLSSCACV